MCRKPIYFKGFARVRDEWAEESWRGACSDVLESHREAVLADACELANFFKDAGWRRSVMRRAMNELKDAEKTTRALMDEDICSEWLEYVLLETDEYYSDRQVGARRYQNDPRPEKPPRRTPRCARMRTRRIFL